MLRGLASRKVGDVDVLFSFNEAVKNALKLRPGHVP